MIPSKLDNCINRFKLPPSLRFYSVGGQKIFSIRGMDGSLTPKCICYFITRKRKNGDYRKFGLEFNVDISTKELKALLSKALLQFKGDLKVLPTSAPIVNLDGGDLGRSDLRS